MFFLNSFNPLNLFLKGTNRLTRASLYYRAPEMFSGGYRQPKDVWAAGILLYELVAGKTPFQSYYHHEPIQNIRNSQLNFSPEFVNYSPELRSMTEKMLNRDPELRPTSNQCLQQRWLMSLKQTEELNGFLFSDKNLFCEQVILGFGSKRKNLDQEKKKNRRSSRSQSLEEMIMNIQTKETVTKDQHDKMLLMALPQVKKINGNQYYCIESSWKQNS